MLKTTYWLLVEGGFGIKRQRVFSQEIRMKSLKDQDVQYVRAGWLFFYKGDEHWEFGLTVHVISSVRLAAT